MKVWLGVCKTACRDTTAVIPYVDRRHKYNLFAHTVLLPNMSRTPSAWEFQNDRQSSVVVLFFLSAHSRTGFHIHGDSAASFVGQDLAPTGHHSTEVFTRGTERHRLGGTQHSRDTTVPDRDSIFTGLHGMFSAGSNNYGTPQYSCIPGRSSFTTFTVEFECCNRRTPQDSINDTPSHEKKKKKTEKKLAAAAAMMHRTSRFVLSNEKQSDEDRHIWPYI